MRFWLLVAAWMLLWLLVALVCVYLAGWLA